MPTLPLHDFPTNPNAWHRVRSPGGYEFWRFQVHDTDSDLRVVAIFSLGGLLRDDYVQRVARYLRKPTRTLPPLPAHYPAVFACVSAQGRQTITRITLKAGDFEASTQPPSFVRFSANSLQWDASGVCRAELRYDQMEVKFAFEPRANVTADEQSPPSEHHRIALASAGHATGSIRCPDGRDIPFGGSGIYEHRYGTRPPIIQTDFDRPWANKT